MSTKDEVEIQKSKASLGCHIPSVIMNEANQSMSSRLSITAEDQLACEINTLSSRDQSSEVIDNRTASSNHSECQYHHLTHVTKRNTISSPQNRTAVSVANPKFQMTTINRTKEEEAVPTSRMRLINSTLSKHKLRPIVFLFFVIQSLVFLYENHIFSNPSSSSSEFLSSSIFGNLFRSRHSTEDHYFTNINRRLPLIKGVNAFDELERVQLRDEARQMFYHAYHSYINTYPADEILPISCRGRFRQVEDSSDIDDSIGNFSLTLVDSLDTLVMMGDIDEFEVAIKKIINDLNFDTDIVVSVFETNIRMLGGLLSAHILAKSIQDKSDRSIRYINATSRRQLDWYEMEILDLAEDLGRRLLPAFETKTGIPHPRVNLKFGMESNELRAVQETCTACAGSLILEFATLSRLTGDSVFEKKARQALDSIWDHRHRSTDLVGTVLNVDSGEWVRRESGVGAGSDSYYEYLMKAYILLGDPTYLHRFNRHYSSVMRYMSRGPFLMDVHMHRPNRIAKGFMDALSAFWPGLQVLKGDLRAAISTHAMFNEVIRRHSYLPEAFTTDLQVYWANHQMRPEFLESTFFLHRATREDYYLEIGKGILRKLQDLKVDCGFAGLKDVRTGVHDDKMSSFVLAETLKYLFLLFSNDNETHVDLDRFIFSTEGHLLPIELNLRKSSIMPATTTGDDEASIFDIENLGAKVSQSILRSSDSQINLGLKEGINSNDDKKEQQKSIRAEITRLLIKMNERFNNDDKSVISLNDYENSCPSLEVQEMRFDRGYHPFLQKRIGANQELYNPIDQQLSEVQISHMELIEKVKEFTSNDPDYLRLASSLGLGLTVQPNGVVRLSLGSSSSHKQQEESLDGSETHHEDGNQCMI